MDPLLVGVLSGIVSGLLSSYLIFRFVKNITEEYIEEDQQEADIIVNIEFQDSVMYLYNKSTSEFLVQGSNWESLYDQLVKKFPNKTIFIDNNQLEKAKRFGNG